MGGLLRETRQGSRWGPQVGEERGGSSWPNREDLPLRSLESSSMLPQNFQLKKHKRLIVADMNAKLQIHLANLIIIFIFKYGVMLSFSTDIAIF